MGQVNSTMYTVQRTLYAVHCKSYVVYVMHIVYQPNLHVGNSAIYDLTSYVGYRVSLLVNRFIIKYLIILLTGSDSINTHRWNWMLRTMYTPMCNDIYVQDMR